MRHVSSRQNPLVAACRSLAGRPDPAARRVLLDGAHLVAEAHGAGLAFEMAAIAASRLESVPEDARLARTLDEAGVDVVTTTDEVLGAMSPVRTPSGMVAIVRREPASVAEVCGAPDAFVVAVTDLQDPGNLGALLRVAEAGGVTGALVCGASANPSGWKVIRGSMGSALRLPNAAGGPTIDVFATARAAGLRMVAAVPRGGSAPDAVDWRAPLALWLGGEGPGLDAGIIAACDVRVTIPMTSPVESLNVAVAAGILVYTARRWRP